MEYIKPSGLQYKAGITFVHVMLFFFICSANVSYAQVSASIYVEKENRVKDTVDFGIVYYERDEKVIRKIYIENTGKTELSVPDIFFPYFLVSQINQTTEEHREFGNQKPVPLSIRPNLTDSVFVYYAPSLDTSEFLYPIGIRVANVTLRPCPLIDDTCSTDIAKLPIKRDFVAKVFKSRNPLTAVKQGVSFDSVYVNTFASDKKPVFFRNISSRKIVLDKPTINETGSSVNGEFTFDPFEGNKPLDTDNEVPVIAQYYPKDRGRDSASIKFTYTPGRNERRDSSSSKLYGFGAQHELTILSVTGNTSGVSVKGKNLIELDPLPVNSDNEITIFFENTGNINTGFTEQLLEGDADQFQITRRMDTVRDLKPTQRDSVKIKFSPRKESDRGYYEANLILRNNIGGRIPSTPDSVRRTVIVIRAKAFAPVLTVIGTQSDTVRFGEFNLPFSKDCKISHIDDTLLIRNTGNTTLKIQTPEIVSGVSSKFLLLNAVADTITEGSEKSLIIRFYPENEGLNESQIEIRSNDPFRKNKVITLLATVNPPDTIKLAAPNFSAGDGERITVPLYCRSGAIRNAQRVVTTFNYEASTIRVIGARSAGSSAGGNVQVQTIEEGVTTVSVNALSAGTFFPNDTLCLLEFSTYLGNVDKIPIVLSASTIGTHDCPERFVPSETQGSFIIDSACLLAYNHINRSSNRFGIRAITPNPSSLSSGEITFELAYKSKVNLSIYTSNGVLIKTLFVKDLPSGLHKVELVSDELTNGVYFLEMKAGKYREMYPFIIRH